MKNKKNIVQWSAVLMLFLGMIGKDVYESFKDRVSLPKENQGMIIDNSRRIDKVFLTIEDVEQDLRAKIVRNDSINRIQWRVLSRKKDK